MLRYYQNEQLVFVALICQVLTGLALLVCTSFGWIGLTGTIALLFIFLCCLGFSSPNTAALSLAPFSRNAGSASALMGAIRMGMGALASMAVSIFSNHTAVPMVAVMAVTSVLALVLLLTGRKQIREQVEVATGQLAEPVH
jgi:DHA1 family bicyclomycin/chloramphenicol resistance-like MFS transporter